MTPEVFQQIIIKIKPYTDHIYLHILGEPLLHPQIEKIIEIAEDNNIQINITTNGSLLGKKGDILLRHQIRQINISLHDAEENIASDQLDSYWQNVRDFCNTKSKDSYINYRLWNEGVRENNAYFHEFIIKSLSDAYKIEPSTLFLKGKYAGIKIAENIFLQHAPRWEWPTENNDLQKMIIRKAS